MDLRIYIKALNIGKNHIFMLILPFIISILFILSYIYLKTYILQIFWGDTNLQYKIASIKKAPTKITFISVNEIVKIIDAIYPAKTDNNPQYNQIKQPKNLVKKQQNLPNYKISFIYIGVNKKYVLINGKLFTEGDFISNQEKIIKIEKDRILLEGEWGKRWIYIIK
ncbi:hypothetical protein [Hydrogenothermus marinus]|uniref:Uncharacterized protein n=1 Tax=Hydrogenothermus marinus TaxID=133270 RepID=A0A3M0BLS0_9AQUI|nr:hypothetical protein [Hydrogenothermus marinus]RMA97536.1 hypothetical protein CLV39_0150 [Hydrogenothermus marinus]